MRSLLLFLLTSWVLALPILSFGCTGGTSAGTLTPTAGYQTQAVTNGQYYAVNVTCGSTYNFTFCSNGGSAAWDTQITINQTNNTTQLAYNDDACGLQSNVSWTANFTGTVHVLISLYSCNNAGGNNGTMAYNVVANTSNPSFTMSPTNCMSASATVTGTTGGTFSFNPVPGGGVTINSTTGAVSNGTPGATYTVQYTLGCSVSSTQNVTLPASGNASFAMAVACGGGTATISGDAGGTFSFNPAPGDGAQINASSGTVSNGAAGTTYFVQYTICGSSSIQPLTVLDDNCWTLNGNGAYINIAGEQCIQLTAESNNQTGCAWNGAQLDFSQDFALNLDYYFGNNINGADGSTFTFQPSASTACGTPGGQLGAGGLANALSIEFDTYDNDSPTHIYDMTCDHIAIEIDGNHQNGVPAAGPVCAKAGGLNIDDGGTYPVDVTWDVSTLTLSVFFNGVLRLTYTNDIVANVFGGQNMVYWGATAATGGLNNQQYFCPSTVVILPVSLSRFDSHCSGDSETFEWVTQSEENTDYFDLEYTHDGTIFYSEATVYAAGNSQSEQTYSARVDATDSQQRYYRIKVVDFDGSIQTSDIIASRNCSNSSDFIQSIQTTEKNITLSLNEEGTVTVFNMMGQRITELTSNQQQVILTKTDFAAGVYQIIATSNSGLYESLKIVVN